MEKMRSFTIICYFKSERHTMKWLEYYGNIKNVAKRYFAGNSHLTRLDVYDDHDNLVCQFMR